MTKSIKCIFSFLFFFMTFKQYSLLGHPPEKRLSNSTNILIKKSKDRPWNFMLSALFINWLFDEKDMEETYREILKIEENKQKNLKPYEKTLRSKL